MGKRERQKTEQMQCRILLFSQLQLKKRSIYLLFFPPMGQESSSVRIGGTNYGTVFGNASPNGPGTIYIKGLPADLSPKDVSIQNEGGQVSFIVHGDLKGSLELNMTGNFLSPIKVIIRGNVHGNVEAMSGDVCVEGSVDTGNVSTMSGDVNVTGNVAGSASTMSGSIRVGGNKRARHDTGDADPNATGKDAPPSTKKPRM